MKEGMILDNQKEIKQKLEKLAKNNPNPAVSYLALFSPEFMQKYTDFASIEFFLSNLKIKDFTDIENINKKQLDNFVKKNTNFKTWLEMQQAAINSYMTNLL